MALAVNYSRYVSNLPTCSLFKLLYSMGTVILTVLSQGHAVDREDLEFSEFSSKWRTGHSRETSGLGSTSIVQNGGKTL